MAVVESADAASAFATHVLPGIVGTDQETLDRIRGQYSITPVPELAHPEPFVQPSLHITGRQDYVVGYRDAFDRLEHYPRATFVVLDGAERNVLIEQPVF